MCIVALVMLAGCGRITESDLIGNWTTLTGSDLQDSAGPGEKIMDAARAVLAPTLDLKEDNKFTLTVGVPISGSWRLEEGQVLLDPETILGYDASEMGNADKQIVFDLGEDGKTLTGSVSSGSFTGSLDFTKIDD